MFRHDLLNARHEEPDLRYRRIYQEKLLSLLYGCHDPISPENLNSFSEIKNVSKTRKKNAHCETKSNKLCHLQ